MKIYSRRACLTVMALSASSFVTASMAQTPAWPTQTVKIIVPYAAGGTTDIAARVLGQELSKRWKQAVVVENMPGASTQIGTSQAAKATDGHTLLLTALPFAVNPTLYAKLPYDTFKDFTPITLVVRSGLFLVTGANQPYNSVKDLIAAGKGSSTVNIASGGNGSMGHMTAELIANAEKLNFQHIPYKTTAQALTGVVGEQVQFFFDNPSSSLPLINSGKLKALAYTGPRRSKALPNVPTMAESGVTNFEAVNWFGLFAPSSVPEAVVTRISADTTEALRKRDIVERFAREGVEVGGISREAFGAFLAIETIKWAKIIKARDIKPD